MRKIIFAMNITLDGYMSGLNGELDWTVVDKQLHEEVIKILNTVEIDMFGRKTYELMANSWPMIENDSTQSDFMISFAKTLNPMKKIVFSRTLQQVEWNTTLINEFDVDQIIELKNQPGKDLMIEGANIAQQFMAYELIDVFYILIHPVILGNGIPLFDHIKNRTNLRLEQVTPFESGVTLIKYSRTS